MREEATHVTVVLGSVYLTYSAFFVTIEIPYLNNIVKVSTIEIFFNDEIFSMQLQWFILF
jgi:hypothetical protein